MDCGEMLMWLFVLLSFISCRLYSVWLHSCDLFGPKHFSGKKKVATEAKAPYCQSFFFQIEILTNADELCFVYPDTLL